MIRHRWTLVKTSERSHRMFTRVCMECGRVEAFEYSDLTSPYEWKLLCQGEEILCREVPVDKKGRVLRRF